MQVTVLGVSIEAYGEVGPTIIKFENVPLEGVTPVVIQHILQTPGVDEVQIVVVSNNNDTERLREYKAS